MKAIVKGIATEYLDEGSGPTVLMLHGWGDSLRSFDTLVYKLGGYRIVRLDLPGFGSTELPRGDWNVADYARFVADFCAKISIVPEYAVGHSFGGRILMKGLGNNILIAKKVVLTGSAGVADRPTLQNTAFMVIAKVGKLLLKPFPTSWYLRLRKELYRVTGGDYISTGHLRNTFIRVINEDLSEDAKRIAVPTLLVWGEDDLVTPLGEGKKLKRMVPNSELRVFPKAGHFVHQQKVDEVGRLIREFFV